MIYIVIPVHNNLSFTVNCLKQLSLQSFNDFKVILVDDGSTDDTYSTVSRDYPEVILLKGTGNLWWAGATNLGIQYIFDNIDNKENDYILTINNDIQIGTDFLKIIYSSALLNPNSIIGSVGIDVNDTNYLEYAGNISNYYTAKTIKIASLFNNNYEFIKKSRKFIQTDDIHGRGTLIPIYIFKEVGFYDDYNFPQHMADLDFSIRAKKSGFNLLIDVHSIVYTYLDNSNDSARTTFKSLLDGFFSLKSSIYYKTRLNFSFKHSPLPYLYFSFDILRIIFGFLKKGNLRS